jgi:hypothetical protein
MRHYNELSKVIDRYEDGEEKLDSEQLFLMLKAGIDGLEDCDKETAYREMLIIAGYSV